MKCFLRNTFIGCIFFASFVDAQVKEPLEVPYVAFGIKMGKGFDVMQANCLMCHSFGYITNQGRQSRKFWEGKIEKMIVHFKAPISKQDFKIIADYLEAHYGNGK